MKHIRGLISITQALRQTFVVPQTLPRPQFFRYPPVRSPSQIRFRYSSPRHNPRNQSGEVKDEDILSDYIQLVNEDNKLGPPVRLSDTLRSIERPEQFILRVSTGARDGFPICKVINRREQQNRERAIVKAAKAAQATKNSVKQVELNWAIDPHDLSHRLKQVTNFLEKGRQVEIILTKKRNKRTPTEEEVKNVMAKTLQATKDANAVQVSPMEGEPGRRVMLTVKKRGS
ncbi:translation initiation factor IF-3, C-terminal domain-containing protein [Aspergillus aurantiobrunneus]